MPPLSLAVGYNTVLRGASLSVTMPGGGTRPGEEVRDGPHNNNRCGGNRGGVAPTAASLKPRVGLGLTGSGLIMRLLVAASFSALLFSTRPSLCLLEALRWAVSGETMTTPGGTRTPYEIQLRPPVLGAPASIIGSGLPPLPLCGTPTLRFVLRTMGERQTDAPLPLLAGIKAHTLREEITHLE